MARFELKADVTVMVGMNIEAEDEEEAFQKFEDKVMVAVQLIEAKEPEDYYVFDEAISVVENLKIKPV